MHGESSEGPHMGYGVTLTAGRFRNSLGFWENSVPAIHHITHDLVTETPTLQLPSGNLSDSSRLVFNTA